MRTRYYNPEVKRFINQDTILGSITNSQSLNRYAYVQGNSISLIDPFGMSPSAGNNAIGHTLLDFTGLIPGIGFVFDVANSVWYVAEGNYTMAALAAFSAIPGLGDAVSAGMLATKGAKAAQNMFDLIKSGSNYVGNSKMNGQFMYVVDTNGNIVIGSRAGQHMPHPTLIGGTNPTVQGAGIVEIRGGKIYSIDNACGHFKPDSSYMTSVQNAFGKLPSNVFHKDFQGYSTFGD